MNLILENPSKKLIKAVKAMAKIENTKVKLKKDKKLTINGFTPEFEKKLLRELEETKEAYKKGKLKAYSVDEFKEALANGESSYAQKPL